MQAALHDLTPTRQTNPRPFLICQRILHKCHELIFGDPPEPSRSPYRSLPHSPPPSTAGILASGMKGSLLRKVSNVESTPVKPKERVREHVRPALVGIGVMLASAPGITGLVDLAGDWAVTQGRRPIEEEGEGRARAEVDKSGGADITAGRNAVKSASASRGNEESDESDEDKPKPKSTPMARPPSSRRLQQLSALSPSPSTAPAHRSAFHLPHPASTAPNLASPPPMASSPQLPNHLPSPALSLGPTKGDDPFSQRLPTEHGSSTPPLTRTHTPPKQTHQPFYSVPEFTTGNQYHNSAIRRLHPTDRPPPPETILATYSLEAQRQLLRSHYCRSQVRFLLVLEDISNRLLVIPKPARVSALRAELTSLNHNLPAEVSYSYTLRAAEN
jgi:hypothetical protein